MHFVIRGSEIVVKIALLVEGSFSRPVIFELEPREVAFVVMKPVVDIRVGATNIADEERVILHSSQRVCAG